jgi:hypothetical protein
VEVAVQSAFLLAAVILGATRSGYELDQVLVNKIPRSDGSMKETRENITVCISGDRARLKQEDGEYLIARLDTDEVFEVDPLTRSYEPGSLKLLATEDDLIIDQIEGFPPDHPQRAELIDVLYNSPKKWQYIRALPAGEMRSALLQKYGLSEDPPTIVLTKSNEKATVAGIEVERWDSTENGQANAWARLARSIAFDQRYYAFLVHQGWVSPELADLLKEKKMRKAGMPLETYIRTRWGAEVMVITKAVREVEFDDDAFLVPDDYTEQKVRSTFR